MIRTLGCLLVAAMLLIPLADSPAAEVAPPPREKIPQTPAQTPVAHAPGSPNSPSNKMPLTGLAPAKPMFDACIYKYPVSTTNAQCQAFVNQGLGMYYSTSGWKPPARSKPPFNTTRNARTRGSCCTARWTRISTTGRTRSSPRGPFVARCSVAPSTASCRTASARTPRNTLGNGPQAHAEGQPPRALLIRPGCRSWGM